MHYLYCFKRFLFLFFFFFFFTFSSPSLSHPFFPANNLTLFGDASIVNSSITLTQQHNCTTSPPPSPPPPSSPATPLSGVGRAFYVNPIRFLDTSTNSTASFSCSFSFTITPSPSCSYGDGLAFLITSNIDSFSLTDGYMGLPEQLFDMQDSFIAVEFDTSYNPSLEDINGNHIGIDVNKVKSFSAIDVDLKGGKEMIAWIEYRDSEKMMRVWLGYSQIKPHDPILESQIDLSKQFKEFMHIGFSASNGKSGSAIHTISRWRFKTFGIHSSTTMPMDTVEEGDCLMCSPGDMNSRSVSSDSHHISKRILAIGFGFGGLALLIIIIIAVIFIYICIMKRRKLKQASDEVQIFRFQGNRVPKRLSLHEIKAATKGFNQDKIVGEGASAVVYEGQIPSCGAVAVKRFSQENRVGPSSSCIPFNTEFATMVGCLRHKNLIQLQGWCCEKNELVLVYEYMANGSLDKILHRRTYFTKYLTWERRLNIVLGVASALIYLHEECESQIIHRDVKTCNIMLDEQFNAKLGDFGLAEVYRHNNSRTRDATVPAGTMGYLAPEYAFSGIPTVKTDVYSFGIVVLEVASGRRPVDEEGTVITEWVWTLWEMGKLIEAADPKLIGRLNRAEMERMLRVGLFCAHPNHEKRPTMREAARMLRGEASLPIFPQKKPTVRIQSILPEGYEDILSFGGELEDTPWGTPRSHFSKN